MRLSRFMKDVEKYLISKQELDESVAAKKDEETENAGMEEN